MMSQNTDERFRFRGLGWKRPPWVSNRGNYPPYLFNNQRTTTNECQSPRPVVSFVNMYFFPLKPGHGIMQRVPRSTTRLLPSSMTWHEICSPLTLGRRLEPLTLMKCSFASTKVVRWFTQMFLRPDQVVLHPDHADRSAQLFLCPCQMVLCHNHVFPSAAEHSSLPVLARCPLPRIRHAQRGY